MENITEQLDTEMDTKIELKNLGGKEVRMANNKMTEPKTYTAYDIVSQKTDTWRECMIKYNYNFSTEDTLDFIKETAKDFDLDDTDVKNIFDECEHPFYYNLDKKEIINGDYEEESDDEDDEEVGCVCKICEGEGKTFVSKERAKELKQKDELEDICPFDKCNGEEECWMVGDFDMEGYKNYMKRLEEIKNKKESESESDEDESDEEDECVSCKKELIDEGVMFMGKYLCLSCAYNNKEYE